MNDSSSDFRIITIDDNPAIHQDFFKILGKHEESHSSAALDKLNQKIFGKKINEKIREAERFEIDSATQGQEGLDKIKQAIKDGHPYSLAFVDIRMPPGWDGIETVKRIWAIDKDIQIVICTAFSDYSWEETVEHLGRNDNLLILKKPFDHVSVRQLACALTRKWQLSKEARLYTSTLKQQVEDRTLSLQESLSLVKATLESSNDGIIVVSNNGTVLDYNQRAVTLWHIPRLLLDNKNYDHWLVYMKGLVENPINLTSHDLNEVVIRFYDGSIVECYSQPQMMNNKIVGRVYNFHDVTKKAKLEEELQYRATHDALTELPNRVMLLNHLRIAIHNAATNHSHFAVMFLDLDRFKLINDSLSHEVGDELLVAASKRLRSTIRPEDILSRLGGDEFIVVLNNLKSKDMIVSKAEKLLNIFRQPFRVADRNVTVTVSIGISFYPDDGVTTDVLLRNADSAMYCAKENGSNMFQFYAMEMNKTNLAKLDQDVELRQGLINGEFFLCYQPQVNLKNNQLVAVEALIRWEHPQKGMLSPMEFIPLAEETGLIIPMGEWALRMACIQNKLWQDIGLPAIRVAVNVSAQQLKQPGFVNSVKLILEETQLKPEYLELELTENVLISSVEVIKSANALKELGIAIAIDDFGTGYSSLSYLKKLPLDRLKIDGSFIQNIKQEGDDEVIIRAIIAVANNLNLTVLAEGVETQSQLDFLINQNCDEVQGFYFSKPLKATDLEVIMASPELLAQLLLVDKKEKEIV